MFHNNDLYIELLITQAQTVPKITKSKQSKPFDKFNLYLLILKYILICGFFIKYLFINIAIIFKLRMDI